MEGHMSETAKKAEYEAPRLTQIGSFEALTQWASGGGYTDRGFPGGTATQDLSFSDAPPAN